MGIQQELGLPHRIETPEHEAVMNIVHTGTLLAKESDRVLRPIGITSAQFNLLMLLKYQSRDGTLNQTRLGEMLLVHRSNITGLVDRMEEAGWVRRRAEDGDRRVNRIGLTARGEDTLVRAEKVYFRRLREAMGSAKAMDQKRLCEALERVRLGLRRSGRRGRG